jgi:GntR family transcriptional regulator
VVNIIDARRSGAQRAPAAPKRQKRTGIAMYRRIARVLRRRISSGEWQPGERLPPLDALVSEFGAGRITVRHAIDLLADEGLVARYRDRRGSSVIREPLDGRWFTLALDLNSLETHSSLAVSLVDSQPWDKPLPVRSGEGEAGTKYQRLVQLHRHKDFPHPVALTDLLVDREIYRSLGKAAHSRPVLELLAIGHADIQSIQQTLTITEADIELARHLQVHESAPIAELRRVIRDHNGKIIYFGHLFFRGELVRLDFSVDLKKQVTAP